MESLSTDSKAYVSLTSGMLARVVGVRAASDVLRDRAADSLEWAVNAALRSGVEAEAATGLRRERPKDFRVRRVVEVEVVVVDMMAPEPLLGLPWGPKGKNWVPVDWLGYQELQRAL